MAHILSRHRVYQLVVRTIGLVEGGGPDMVAETNLGVFTSIGGCVDDMGKGIHSGTF